MDRPHDAHYHTADGKLYMARKDPRMVRWVELAQEKIWIMPSAICNIMIVSLGILVLAIYFFTRRKLYYESLLAFLAWLTFISYHSHEIIMKVKQDVVKADLEHGAQYYDEKYFGYTVLGWRKLMQLMSVNGIICVITQCMCNEEKYYDELINSAWLCVLIVAFEVEEVNFSHSIFLPILIQLCLFVFKLMLRCNNNIANQLQVSDLAFAFVLWLFALLFFMMSSVTEDDVHTINRPLHFLFVLMLCLAIYVTLEAVRRARTRADGTLVGRVSSSVGLLPPQGQAQGQAGLPPLENQQLMDEMSVQRKVNNFITATDPSSTTKRYRSPSPGDNRTVTPMPVSDDSGTSSEEVGRGNLAARPPKTRRSTGGGSPHAAHAGGDLMDRATSGGKPDDSRNNPNNAPAVQGDHPRSSPTDSSIMDSVVRLSGGGGILGGVTVASAAISANSNNAEAVEDTLTSGTVSAAAANAAAASAASAASAAVAGPEFPGTRNNPGPSGQSGQKNTRDRRNRSPPARGAISPEDGFLPADSTQGDSENFPKMPMAQKFPTQESRGESILPENPDDEITEISEISPQSAIQARPPTDAPGPPQLSSVETVSSFIMDMEAGRNSADRNSETGKDDR